ncbi:hypothetical protein KIPB_009660, partial [Kipferlia bialata]|eukprot:g9660.t1
MEDPLVDYVTVTGFDPSVKPFLKKLN